MTAKEDTRRRPGRRALRLPVAMRLCECGIRFLLSAVLAGAEIFGDYAMFGVAMVGVTGVGAEGLSALLGATLGYLSFRGFLGGLRYVAACMLVYALGLALGDFQICRARWFMPVVTAALNALVGFVYLSAGGWTGQRAVLFATEVVLTGAAVYLYRLAFSVWEERRDPPQLSAPQLVGVLVLACTLLMALTRVTPGGRASVGRVFAALIVMTAGWKGGVGAGTVAGVAAGLAMDLSAGGDPFFTMAWSFAGLLCGSFSRQGRIWSMLAFLTATAAVALWTRSGESALLPVLEVTIAAAVFLILPEKLLRRLSALLRQEGAREETARVSSYAAGRLRETAGAFRSLCDSLDGFYEAPVNDGDALKLFDRAADTVCAGCSRRQACWQQDYQSTKNALNEALPALLDRGECRAGDFPPWFAERCLHLPLFLSASDRELEKLLARRRYDSRIRESRAAVCAQYDQLAGVLERAAAEMSAELTVDVKRQRQVKQRLTALGLEGRCAVFQDEHRHLCLELEGRGVEKLGESGELLQLSQLLDCPLRVQESGRDMLRLAQQEPLMAIAGVAALGRDGMPVSGDAGAWFKDDAGRLYMLLCDGMGSGLAAHRDSDSALRLLEKFLRAGMTPRNALKTVGEALALRGEEEGGFTTVDLLQVDLFTGRGAVLKLGAAPTYLRRGSGADRLSGASLPAGLMSQRDGEPDVFPLELHAGDVVVMLSDGIASDRDDGWLMAALEEFDGISPQSLAQRLLSESRDHTGGADDRTVVVLKLDIRS